MFTHLPKYSTFFKLSGFFLNNVRDHRSQIPTFRNSDEIALLSQGNNDIMMHASTHRHMLATDWIIRTCSQVFISLAVLCCVQCQSHCHFVSVQYQRWEFLSTSVQTSSGHKNAYEKRKTLYLFYVLQIVLGHTYRHPPSPIPKSVWKTLKICGSTVALLRGTC